MTAIQRQAARKTPTVPVLICRGDRSGMRAVDVPEDHPLAMAVLEHLQGRRVKARPSQVAYVSLDAEDYDGVVAACISTQGEGDE